MRCKTKAENGPLAGPFFCPALPCYKVRVEGAGGGGLSMRQPERRRDVMAVWRTVGLVFGLASFGLASILPAAAQDYPARNVRLIVPFGAGGPADVYARVIAQHLSDQLKQAFVVEDRPGAG